MNPVKLGQLDRLSTEALQASLLPGQEGCLKTRPEGTILDGHHRIHILRQRGVDVAGLPREIGKGSRAKMRKELYWVDGPWPGKLAIAARSRGGDWLEDDLYSWRQPGTDTVLSLLTLEEEKDLDLRQEAGAAG